MRKQPTSQSGLFNPRILLAFTLCVAASFLAMMSFASTPPSGTISPTSGNLTYDAGPFPGVNQSPLGAGQLDDGPRCDNTGAFPCDNFDLTVSVPPGYLTANPNAGVKVTLYWDNTSPAEQGASDYDLYIYKGAVTTLNGSQPADFQSAGDETANPEVATIIPLTEGVSIYTIKVVPWKHAGEVIHVGIQFLSGSGGTGFPGFGGPDPTIPGVPRYQVSVGGDVPTAGESNVGFNLLTGKIMTMNRFTVWRVTGAEKLSPPKPECCPEVWENKTNTTTSQGVDPILWTDRVSGRTFASNSTAGTNVVYAYTDNDGELWNPLSLSPPNISTDHQTIGSGPYPAALSALSNPVNQGQMVFYCAQTWPVGPAACQRSDTLGASYGPSATAYTGNAGDPCGGIHGHIKVGPDGTVYLPVRGCGDNAGMAVSLDGGITWTSHVVPNSDPGGSDPSVAIGANNTIYYFYTKRNADNTEIHMHVQVGKLTRAGTPAVPTITWSKDTDLGASHGVVHSVFPEAVAGDDNRAAVGFLGTDRAGFSEGLTFPGYWYLFISTTYDGGNTWQTVNATPNDPVQGKGGIWLGGGGNTNRNLLDFNEVTMDEKGRVIFAYGDGCTGGCVGNPDNNTFRAATRLARQVGGKSLLAAHDIPEPALPLAACLSGTRNASGVHLTWRTPDNRGADIIHYRIFRGTASGNEVFIGQTVGPKTTFDDITVDPAQAAFYYVKAVNSVDPAGGIQSNEVNFPGTPGIWLQSVSSRKLHGATPFNITLPLDGTAIESRSGGASGDYTVVFKFAAPVSEVTGASVSSTGAGSNPSITNRTVGPNNEYIVSLTNVPNAQYTTVTLTGVTTTGGTTPTLSATMGVLVGDITTNRAVSNTDVAGVKGQISAPVTASNFRMDVNANGIVSNTDVSTTKGQISTALP